MPFEERKKDDRYYYLGKHNIADLVTGACTIVILFFLMDAWLPKG